MDKPSTWELLSSFVVHYKLGELSSANPPARQPIHSTWWIWNGLSSRPPWLMSEHVFFLEKEAGQKWRTCLTKTDCCVWSCAKLYGPWVGPHVYVLLTLLGRRKWAGYDQDSGYLLGDVSMTDSRVYIRMTIINIIRLLLFSGTYRKEKEAGGDSRQEGTVVYLFLVRDKALANNTPLNYTSLVMQNYYYLTVCKKYDRVTRIN